MAQSDFNLKDIVAEIESTQSKLQSLKQDYDRFKLEAKGTTEDILLKLESLRDNILDPAALKKLPVGLQSDAYLWPNTYNNSLSRLPKYLQEGAIA